MGAAAGRAIPRLDVPPVREIDPTIMADLRPLVTWQIVRPSLALAAFVRMTVHGWWVLTPVVVRMTVHGWWVLTPLVVGAVNGSTLSAVHHLIHGGLGLSPRWRHLWLTVLERLVVESGHAPLVTQARHHRDGSDTPDPEGYIEYLSWRHLWLTVLGRLVVEGGHAPLVTQARHHRDGSDTPDPEGYIEYLSWRHLWLTVLERLVVESGHAPLATQARHHRDGSDTPDPEGYIEYLSWRHLWLTVLERLVVESGHAPLVTQARHHRDGSDTPDPEGYIEYLSWRHLWLTVLERLVVESGHAPLATQARHHRDGSDTPDPEGYIEYLSWRRMPAGAVKHRYRLMIWAWWNSDLARSHRCGAGGARGTPPRQPGPRARRRHAVDLPLPRSPRLVRSAARKGPAGERDTRWRRRCSSHSACPPCCSSGITNTANTTPIRRCRCRDSPASVPTSRRHSPTTTSGTCISRSHRHGPGRPAGDRRGRFAQNRTTERNTPRADWRP